MKHGKLILIPAGLGSVHPKLLLSAHTLENIYRLRFFITERAKTARSYLKSIDFPVPMSEIEVLELNKHKAENYHELLHRCVEGYDCGLLSEAGVPGVADPGGGVVAAAHKLGIEIVPLVGASSILLALMASGMNGQQFVFHGYLPKSEDALFKTIKNIENASNRQNQTQIFIETPFRNEKLKEALIKTLSSNTRLCLAISLTAAEQKIVTKTVAEWKNMKINIDRKPTVFLIYAGNDVK